MPYRHRLTVYPEVLELGLRMSSVSDHKSVSLALDQNGFETAGFRIALILSFGLSEKRQHNLITEKDCVLRI